MKTALCLSGESRTFNKCFQSQYDHIIKPLNADVFVHTWTFGGNPELFPSRDENYDIHKHLSFIDSYEYSTPLTEINQLYKPKTMVVEYPDYNFFIDKIKQSKILFSYFYFEKNKEKGDNRYKLFNMLMMYYGIYNSNLLKKKFEDIKGFKYDLVIRCRFDLYFKKVVFELEKNVIYLPPNKDINVLFPEEMNKLLLEKGMSFMPNDKFAYGDSGSMDYYSSIYEFYDKDVDYYTLHPEAGLSEHLWEKNESEYKDIRMNNNIEMKILR